MTDASACTEYERLSHGFSKGDTSSVCCSPLWLLRAVRRCLGFALFYKILKLLVMCNNAIYLGAMNRSKSRMEQGGEFSALALI